MSECQMSPGETDFVKWSSVVLPEMFAEVSDANSIVKAKKGKIDVMISTRPRNVHQLETSKSRVNETHVKPNNSMLQFLFQ